jgi:hypothetical protein
VRRATSGVVARDLPTWERVTGSTVASPGIRLCRGAEAGATQRRTGDGAARGDLGTTEAGDDGGNGCGWTRNLTAQVVEGRGGRRPSAYKTPAKRRSCAEPRSSVMAWPDLGRERAWEEIDGGRLKKPLMCGAHTSVR